MNASEAVQRQLKDDWDNREFEQVLADNIKSIANFLSTFGSYFLPFL
ncbi:Protein CBG26242 [Caenorhabditis briggsae]|uniref:Protein CBG26242 n=1 Tax=Caenorhabditis briggsae TaxID=6238 RepID=B6ILW3_CAEBR|nr:Protein CBG26242 [Caenorhabditis briggsae]CAS00893.1 Protein CBG26242 [Caenorhabditis briggsae]